MKKMKSKLKIFLGVLLVAIISVAVWQIFLRSNEPSAPQAQETFKRVKIVKREAKYYEKMSSGYVRCTRCPLNCVLPPGGVGYCRARKNIKGKLYTLVYGNPCAVHVDPIEKKPLFHLLPGTGSFSISTAGCNFRCRFCQNWQISQRGPEEVDNVFLPPKEVVRMAKEAHCRTIAFTYGEPGVFSEYMLDTAEIAKKAGIKTLMHSNGYWNPKPLRDLCPYLDAANIDLKGFTDKFYQKFCGGELEPVLRSLKILKEEGVWLEVTNLIIPGANDDMKTIKKMCIWIKKNLGPDVPLHFSRFYPMYKLENLPPTPIKTLEQARKVALGVGLHYVYIGNVSGHPAENTYCPQCKKLLIEREGYVIKRNNIVKGKCKFCGKIIAGVWR